MGVLANPPFNFGRTGPKLGKRGGNLKNPPINFRPYGHLLDLQSSVAHPSEELSNFGPNWGSLCSAACVASRVARVTKIAGTERLRCESRVSVPPIRSPFGPSSTRHTMGEMAALPFGRFLLFRPRALPGCLPLTPDTTGISARTLPGRAPPSRTTLRHGGGGRFAAGLLYYLPPRCR
jgi:hypothetical protein